MDPRFPAQPVPTQDPGPSDGRSWGAVLSTIIAAGAALVLTVAHAMRVVAQDTVAGSAITLPAALGTGNVYRVIVTVAGNAHSVITAPNTDFFFGGIVINDTGDTSAATADFFPTAANSNKISQTTVAGGGKVGDWLEFTDIAAGKWAVRGVFQGAVDPATPFSNV
jgi:hypothetical protein